jgi:hypothetical protein
MKNQHSTAVKLLYWLAVAGNFIFILWILYNGIDENFQGTIPEKVSYISLISLLGINSFLILKSKNQLKSKNLN